MTTNVQIRLASKRVNNTLVTGDNVPRLFTPGEVITGQLGFMRLGYTNPLDTLSIQHS